MCTNTCVYARAHMCINITKAFQYHRTTSRNSFLEIIYFSQTQINLLCHHKRSTTEQGQLASVHEHRHKLNSHKCTSHLRLSHQEYYDGSRNDICYSLFMNTMLSTLSLEMAFTVLKSSGPPLGMNQFTHYMA